MSENNQSLILYDLDGREKGKISLDPKIFDGEVNTHLLYQIKIMYEANQRKGTASTKTRGEVRGGGKKPWRQKGTGRARAGSIRSPLWRGGGKVFGPKPRDYSYRLPKKMIKRAIKDCLNMHWKEASLKLIDEDIKLEKPKTKFFAQILEKLGLSGKILFLLKEIKPEIRLATRNISGLVVKEVKEVNPFDFLYNEKVILTPSALEELMEGIKKWI